MGWGSCFAVKFDTLENGALIHGMGVDILIERLNSFIYYSSPMIKQNALKPIFGDFLLKVRCEGSYSASKRCASKALLRWAKKIAPKGA